MRQLSSSPKTLKGNYHPVIVQFKASYHSVILQFKITEKIRAKLKSPEKVLGKSWESVLELSTIYRHQYIALPSPTNWSTNWQKLFWGYLPSLVHSTTGPQCTTVPNSSTQYIVSQLHKTTIQHSYTQFKSSKVQHLHSTTLTQYHSTTQYHTVHSSTIDSRSRQYTP